MTTSRYTARDMRDGPHGWWRIKDRILTIYMRYFDRPDVTDKIKEFARERQHRYNLTPEVRERQRQRGQTPEVKERRQEYCTRPEVIASRKEYASRPEVKARGREARRKKYHTPEHQAWLKEYQQRPDVKARNAKLASARRAMVKLEVLKHYSGPIPMCARCGVLDVRFLVLDHVDGDGGIDRRTSKIPGAGYYAWLKRNNYPAKLQVLCFSCNLRKSDKRIEYKNHYGVSKQALIRAYARPRVLPTA